MAKDKDDRPLAIVVPIAYDLARNEGGEVILGPGTQKACDEAVTFARATPHSVVFLSAGRARHFDNVMMGLLMRKYINEAAPDVLTEFNEAPSFNTHGEIRALARFMSNRFDRGYAITRVIIAVKDWHAPRTTLLAHKVLDVSFYDVPLEIRTHPLPASFKTRMMERVKTIITRFLL